MQKDGEFGEGNLVFKQFRNDGYLDTLKDRMYKVKSKELSLESLNRGGVKKMKFRLLEYFEDDDFEDEYPKEDVVEYIYNAIDTEDILDLIGAQLQPHIKADTPMFITPKGRFVYVDQITKDSGLTHFEHLQHWNIADIFLNGVMDMAIEDNPSLTDHINKYRMAYITDSTYQNELFTALTDELGWARINCGITASDSRFYAVLPNRMTSGVLDALSEWLEWGLPQ